MSDQKVRTLRGQAIKIRRKNGAAVLAWQSATPQVALAASLKAVALEPRNIDALLVQAQAAVAAKRDDDAQATYGVIADIYASPDAPATQKADPSARYNQGVLLVRLNRLADALAGATRFTDGAGRHGQF